MRVGRRLLCDREVAIELERPEVSGLADVVEALRAWQVEGDPVQLHPGDLGWFWRWGDDVTAASVRVWRRDGRIVAMGLQDESTVLRMAFAPSDRSDDELLQRVADDLQVASRGVLPDGPVSVELPPGAPLRDVLQGLGWVEGEAWTPLVRDLTGPVDVSGLRVEVITADRASVRTAVQRAAFDKSTFTDERWQDVAAGPAYADARCLVLSDEREAAVAAATVWSAGAGRPGLVEPLGVHRDHRGRGHGRSVTLAAAAALRDLGASSAQVITPSGNVAAVATYASAGFEALPERLDLARPA